MQDGCRPILRARVNLVGGQCCRPRRHRCGDVAQKSCQGAQGLRDRRCADVPVVYPRSSLAAQHDGSHASPALHRSLVACGPESAAPAVCVPRWFRTRPSSRRTPRSSHEVHYTLRQIPSFQSRSARRIVTEIARPTLWQSRAAIAWSMSRRTSMMTSLSKKTMTTKPSVILIRIAIRFVTARGTLIIERRVVGSRGSSTAPQ